MNRNVGKACVLFFVILALVSVINARAAASGCDLNSDGQITILDIQMATNCVLTRSCSADINGDGLTDVLDVQVLINVVLGVTSCPSVSTTSTLATSTTSISSTTTTIATTSTTTTSTTTTRLTSSTTTSSTTTTRVTTTTTTSRTTTSTRITTTTTTSSSTTTTTLLPMDARVGLDNPVEGQALSGVVNGNGWSFVLSGNTGQLPSKIEVMIDGRVAMTATQGMTRADVKSHFAGQGITVPENTGFSFAWLTYSYPAGAHTLSIRVSDGMGRTAEFARISVNILPGPTLGNLRLVPAGNYMQGSPSSEAGRLANEAQFSHTLTKNLLAMETEVTRGMWAALRAAQPELPADPTDIAYGAGMNNPVQKMTWYEAVLFANLMSKQAGLTRVYYKDAALTQPVDGSNYTSGEIYADWKVSGFRLPTEGEWEYLARAGATGPFTATESAYSQSSSGSCQAGALKTLETLAWFCANRGGGTHEVGSKRANSWTLADVQGNVWEWVWDWYGLYPTSATTDYRGPATGDGRVKRGGSWNNFPRNVRLAARGNQAPGMRCTDLGFRLVQSTASIDSFAASPQAIVKGSSSTLSWSASHATSCSIDQGIGVVPCVGSRMVTPAATTTYTLTASGLVPVTRSVTIGMIGMAYAKDNIVGNMMLVPAGTFTQGSPTSEVGRDDNETQFTHTLTLNLAVMETAVTRQMWADLKAADSSMPSDPTVTSRGSGMNNPVQRVTWYEAILFANLLSKKAGLTQAYSLYGSTVDASNYQSDSIDCNFRASGYRLPTEGEREYFTRAGSTTPFSINEPAYDWNTCSSCTKGALPALESVAWFCATAGETSHPVGEKAANGWGLIDIHGNVDEWCWDWEASYPGGLQTDYRGPSSGLDRVRRGGSWSSSPQGVRSAFRLRYKPGYRYLDGLGFRLVRSLP